VLLRRLFMNPALFPDLQLRAVWWVCLAAVAVGPVVLRADDTAEFFENEIRPLLVEKCSRCHGAEKQSGGLRIDSKETLLRRFAGMAI